MKYEIKMKNKTSGTVHLSIANQRANKNVERGMSMRDKTTQ